MMPKFDVLRHGGFSTEPYVCASCGNCTLVCPVFRQMKWEPYGSRGKLHVIKSIVEGREEFDEDFVKKVFMCALCEHCTEVCTTSINLDRYWESARRYALEEGLLPPPAAYARESVLSYGDPFSMGASNRMIWSEGVEELVQERINTPAEIAYFLGCHVGLNAQVQDIARSMVKILDYAGVDFALLGELETCCGAPLVWAGDPDSAPSVNGKNIEAMRKLGVRTIIFSCPSCITAWQNTYYQIHGKPVSGEFELLTPSQYIARLNQEGLLEFEEQPMVTVTFHDPCISARKLKVTREPRDVIERIPGVYKVETVPSEQDTRCCGSHALLNRVDPLLASQIAEMRLRDFSVTPATMVITECPRCIRAFDLARMTLGYKVELRDITQIVASSLKPKNSGGQ
jgi:Fe-S oxidoreductase